MDCLPASHRRLAFSAKAGRNRRVCAASAHSKRTGESPNAGIAADVAEFLSPLAGHPVRFAFLSALFRFSTYELRRNTSVLNVRLDADDREMI